MKTLFAPFVAYTRWLHTRWPAGTVERLPAVNEDGSTNVPGVYIVGDLTGIPLLKFSSDSGARAVQTICADPLFQRERGAQSDVLDLVIIGAGVAGVAAAMEAKKQGLPFKILEASQPFLTIVNFPKAKPIFTYPRDMKPAGDLQFTTDVKEALVEELNGYLTKSGLTITNGFAEKIERKGSLLHVSVVAATVPSGKGAGSPPGTAASTLTARRVIVAIGRSGNFRKLGVPGEKLDKVSNRLHDPKDYRDKHVLVVGGGDSAMEAAIALAMGGARVTLSYRKKEFSRPKPENVEKIEMLQRDPNAKVMVEHPTSERVTTSAGAFMDEHGKNGTLQLRLGTQVKEIKPDSVVLADEDGKLETLPNDAVFSMIGREAPLEFFRRSGIRINGEWTTGSIVSFALFLIFCVLLYHWKGEAPNNELGLHTLFTKLHAFPEAVPQWFDRAGGKIADWSNHETNLLFTLKQGVGKSSFYYTLAYCAVVVIFGIRRIRRRQTPYVRWQTITLMCFQCIPLFVLPEIVLPWMGRNGMFSNGGAMQWLADHLFESYDAIGHERAYWRAYGFILAFPLNVYNVFTDHPMWLWLAICFVQTFVVIPLIIWRWGKGAYCGWICSCGALAETLGDAHRAKMPHGPIWNRVNMVGQAVLGFAFLLLGFRILGWTLPGKAGMFFSQIHTSLFEKIPFLNYHWGVDIFMGGIIGVGMYFWFSGRVWCRFACPLAALMHIYARFSRFRIFADKKKCISCNVCTSVCHQGIDIMNFANKGVPMQDPECVRCSACVQSCPTGVLTFGYLKGKNLPMFDKLAASPVQMREGAAKH